MIHRHGWIAGVKQRLARTSIAWNQGIFDRLHPVIEAAFELRLTEGVEAKYA
jgi:hypothetical protein